MRTLLATLANTSNLPDAAYDSIVANKVIEQSENPKALAREWHRLLRPGGTLTLTTSNNESYRAILSLIFRGHFNGNKTSLVRRSIEGLLFRTGFREPQFIYNHGKRFSKYVEVRARKA